MNTKVAICGKLRTKFCAPFDDNTWDIWFCNYHMDFFKIKRYDAWYDIHHNPNKDLIRKIEPDKMRLRDNTIFDRAYELFGGEYITNSMNYMLMDAYFRGYKEVCYYGCLLNSFDEDRTFQKESLNMITMFLRGKGMIINSCEPTLFYNYYKRYNI